MQLKQLKLEVMHQDVYQPKGEIRCTVTHLYWDVENLRPCVELLYNNGYIDHYPLDELFQVFKVVS